MRTLLRVLAWGALAVIGLFAALVVINLFDEDLTPEAKALLAPPPIATPPEKNGYFLLVGLTAPLGEDAHKWGQWQVRVRARADERNDLKDPEYRKAVKASRATPADLPCASMFSPQNDCLSFALTRRAELDAWIAAHPEHMTRFHALRGFAVFEETFLPVHLEIEMPAEYEGRPLTATLMHIASLAHAGKANEALGELEQELALHRRILEGARTFRGKQDAVGRAARGYMLLSVLLQEHRPAVAPVVDRFPTLVKPLSAREVDLTGALRTWFRERAAAMLANCDCGTSADEPWLANALEPFFYQPRATVNLWARVSNVILGYAKEPPTELAARGTALNARIASLVYTGFGRNPSGKSRVEYEGSIPERGVSYANYLRHVYDLDGLIRLVALQARIVGNDVADADVPELIAKSEKELADPFTGQPMRWDAESRQIYFTRKEAYPRTWYNNRFGRSKERVAVTIR